MQHVQRFAFCNDDADHSDDRLTVPAVGVSSAGVAAAVTRAELYGEGRLKYPLVTA